MHLCKMICLVSEQRTETGQRSKMAPDPSRRVAYKGIFLKKIN